MANNKHKILFGHEVLEFATVGIEFCAFLEKSSGRDRQDFLSALTKLLPLLYVKAQLLPEVDSDGTFLPQGSVTESDYDYIRRIVFDILGDDDQYLDFTSEQTMETDEVQWKSVSEHLADVYQPVRNFLAVLQDGIDECVNDALWSLREDFELYWGEALVNAIKQLHKLRYLKDETAEE